MKNLLQAAFLTAALSVATLAGDVPHPRPEEPPPCTENCTGAAPANPEDDTTSEIYEAISSLLNLLF